MTTDIASIAAGLSEDQKAMIRCSRPKILVDGEPADFIIHGRGVVKHALMRRGLADGYRLTPRGVAIRHHLDEKWDIS